MIRWLYRNVLFPLLLVWQWATGRAVIYSPVGVVVP